VLGGDVDLARFFRMQNNNMAGAGNLYLVSHLMSICIELLEVDVWCVVEGIRHNHTSAFYKATVRQLEVISDKSVT
jgi:hypothetical protein